MPKRERPVVTEEEMRAYVEDATKFHHRLAAGGCTMSLITYLRATVDKSSPAQVLMLAVIDTIAAHVGDDHTQILAALHSAYCAVACATENPDAELAHGEQQLALLRRKIAKNL